MKTPIAKDLGPGGWDTGRQRVETGLELRDFGICELPDGIRSPTEEINFDLHGWDGWLIHGSMGLAFLVAFSG
jgi:hypothetical protein